MEGHACLPTSTNRILFAIVVLLFALVLRFVTNSLDLFVILIALAGLVIGINGIVNDANEPH